MRKVQRLRSLAFVGSVGSLSSCSPASQEPVELTLQARGTDTASLTLNDGTVLELTDARLAFGPLTLCPGQQSGALCDTARLEWLDAGVIDLLDGSTKALGTLHGSTGTVRSYMYDLGYVSLLTEDQPMALPATEELDDASFVAHGRAIVPSGSSPVPFSIKLRANQTDATDRGQPLVRLTGPPGFPVDVSRTSKSIRYTFEVSELLDGLRAATFYEETTCEGDSIVCRGSEQEDCQSGVLTDCASLDQVCAPQQGCQDEVSIDAASPAGRSILQRLVAGTPPTVRFR